MRVLWFSNTPAAGDEYISSNGTGGWLKSLDKAIQDKLELHVAFVDRHYPNEFTIGKTTYHQLSPRNKKSLIKGRIYKLFGRNIGLERCLSLIMTINPDIIHIHGTERSWIEIARYTDKPILLSIQAILQVMNYKYFSGITSSDLPNSSNYIKAYKGFLEAGIIEKVNVKYVKYVMGRTDWDRRVYSVMAPQAHYFVGGEILRDGFYNNKWSQPKHAKDRFVIYTTTGTLLFKGYETVCKAVSLLTNIGINVEWRIAGISENDEIVNVVKRVLKKDYPSKGLQLLGSLNEIEVIDKMLEADVYVSPTHQDNSSNALCEATILGMPCIATFAGGTGSIIIDKQTGILVQDGDPWAIAGAILELMRDKELAMQYAIRAREEALVRHDRNTVVNQVIGAYHSIMKDSRDK